MKKYIVALFTLLTLGAMRASAQNTPPRWSVALAAGRAFPVNGFHQTAALTGSAGPSGLAQTGGSAEISASWHFSRSISATLVAEGQENNGNGLVYTFLTPDTKAPAGSPKGNNWKIARFMAGPVYSLPLSKKTGPTLLVRLIGGLQKTTSPDFKAGLYTAFENLAVIEIVPTSYHGLSFPWAFNYEADAGLSWKFGGRFAALAWAGYQGSRVSTVLPYTPYALTPNVQSPKVTFNTATISFRAGISYELSH